MDPIPFANFSVHSARSMARKLLNVGLDQVAKNLRQVRRRTMISASSMCFATRSWSSVGRRTKGKEDCVGTCLMYFLKCHFLVMARTVRSVRLWREKGCFVSSVVDMLVGGWCTAPARYGEDDEVLGIDPSIQRLVDGMLYHEASSWTAPAQLRSVDALNEC